MITYFCVSKSKCISCGSHNFIQFYKSVQEVLLANNHRLNFQQDLECCYECGLVRQKENESYSDVNLEKYYTQTFRTPVLSKKLESGDKRVINSRKRIDFISKLKAKGNLLEIGFGDGVFLGLASENYSCTGLDPSMGYKYLYPDLIEKGVKISEQTLDRYSSKNKFDIVCSFLVLEHIKNPLKFLQLQIKRLKQDGVLVIEVPDIRKYLQFNSDSVLTIEHVYHYCIESLTRLLSTINFKLIKSTNNNVSYGFSLISAFKRGKGMSSKIETNGFTVIRIFQEFLVERIEYQKRMTVKLRSILWEAKKNNKKIAVYGTGYLFNYAINSCNLDIKGINSLVDDTTEKHGMKLFEKDVKPLSEISKIRPDVILVFSEIFFELMRKNILDIYNSKDLEIMDVHKLSNKKI